MVDHYKKKKNNFLIVILTMLTLSVCKKYSKISLPKIAFNSLLMMPSWTCSRSLWLLVTVSIQLFSPFFRREPFPIHLMRASKNKAEEVGEEETKEIIGYVDFPRKVKKKSKS